MSVASPTARTVTLLRARGYIATRVEQRLPIPGGRPVTRDAFGFGDILACKPDCGVLLVQATSRSHVNARIKKAIDSDIVGSSVSAPVLRPNPVRLNLSMWLRSGGRFEIWGWAKGGPKGEPKRWTCRRVVVLVHSDGNLMWSDDDDEESL